MTTLLRTLVFFALLGAMLATGCARRYVVTLTNGDRLAAMGRPRLEKGYYHFKSASGQEVLIPERHVREIAHESLSQPPTFTVPPAR